MKKHIMFKGVRYNKNKGGYYRSSDKADGSKAKVLHRAKWEYYKGAIPEGFVVHHKDHNKDNNELSNLMLMEWGAHTTHHKKSNKCQKQYMREYNTKYWKKYKQSNNIPDRNKLNELDVIEIREMLGKGILQKMIASKFGVTVQMICKINRGRCWEKLKEQ